MTTALNGKEALGGDARSALLLRVVLRAARVLPRPLRSVLELASLASDKPFRSLSIQFMAYAASLCVSRYPFLSLYWALFVSFSFSLEPFLSRSLLVLSPFCFGPF